MKQVECVHLIELKLLFEFLCGTSAVRSQTLFNTEHTHNASQHIKYHSRVEARQVVDGLIRPSQSAAHLTTTITTTTTTTTITITTTSTHRLAQQTSHLKSKHPSPRQHKSSSRL